MPILPAVLTLVAVVSLRADEDRGRIAFYSGAGDQAEIYLVEPDGSRLTRLTSNGFADQCPAWAPDGARLAFVSNRDGNGEIYVMLAEGTGQRRLTRTQGDEHHPDWSPDGTRLLFMAERDGNQDIYVMRDDGSGEIRLTSDPAVDMRPHWSPDGRRVVFSSNRDGNFEIYVMNADGGDVRRLTTSPVWEVFPRFSPDGTRILFASGYAGRREADVHVMNADGTGEEALTSAPGRDEDPVWSPDGRSIAFQSERDGRFEIWVMDADGSRQRRLTDMPDGSFWPAWGPDDESRSRSPRQADVGVPIVIGEELSVVSEALGREITLDVYLPPGYGERPARYPVLYTFQSFFHHVSGVADYLARIDAAPDMIVVSVRNYSSAELSPEVLPSNPDSGGADRFLRFFSDELLPFVDARYRTAPYRLLYAGSFGGGFVVHSALVRPATFNAYLAATPAIDYEGQSRFIATHAESWLRERAFHNRYLFMAVEDDAALAATMETFTALLRRAAPAGLTWEYHHWADEDHGTLPHRVVLRGLRQAFARWSRLPPEVAAGGEARIRTYERDLAAWYGYDIGLSRASLFGAVNDRLGQGDGDGAARIARLLVERYPRDELGRRLLGRAYEQAGQLDAALAAYERAYELAVENHSPHAGVIKGSLDTVRRKIRPPSADRAPVRDRG